MATYATTKKFGKGNRAKQARVTDSVVVAMPRHDGEKGVCLRAAVVAAVSSSEDRPYVLPVGESSEEMTPEMFNFVDTENAADLADLPPWSWTWPPPL